jgi:hypothetical protein
LRARGLARRMLPGAGRENAALACRTKRAARRRGELPGAQDRLAGPLPAGRVPFREIFAEGPHDHPGSCYLNWVNIPEPGISPLFACSSPPSDTVIPHERPITGMLHRHPRLASGRGGCSVVGFIPGRFLLLLVTACVSAAFAGNNGTCLLAVSFLGGPARAGPVWVFSGPCRWRRQGLSGWLVPGGPPFPGLA